MNIHPFIMEYLTCAFLHLIMCLAGEEKIITLPYPHLAVGGLPSLALLGLTRDAGARLYSAYQGLGGLGRASAAHRPPATSRGDPFGACLRPICALRWAGSCRLPCLSFTRDVRARLDGLCQGLGRLGPRLGRS